jgi:hypothetical protein
MAMSLQMIFGRKQKVEQFQFPPDSPIIRHLQLLQGFQYFADNSSNSGINGVSMFFSALAYQRNIYGFL